MLSPKVLLRTEPSTESSSFKVEYITSPLLHLEKQIEKQLPCQITLSLGWFASTVFEEEKKRYSTDYIVYQTAFPVSG